MKIVVLAAVLLACMSSTVSRTLFEREILDMRLARFHIPPPKPSLDDVIHAAAHKHQISSALVKSIIAAESGFSPQVVSSKGAVGLMQLMPQTARELGADPTVPEQNVDAGAQYLSTLLKRFSNKKNALPAAIAAYNAGPGAVEHYHGVPPYRETRAYVTRVLHLFDQYAQQEGLAIPPQERPFLMASATPRAGHHRGRRSCRRTERAFSRSV
jgi:soluble lytic murein transglycosylase-like protein